MELISEALTTNREDTDAFKQWFSIISRMFPSISEEYMEKSMSIKDMLKLLVMCEKALGQELTPIGSISASKEQRKKYDLHNRLRVVPTGKGGISEKEISKDILSQIENSKNAREDKVINWEKDKADYENWDRSDKDVDNINGVETIREYETPITRREAAMKLEQEVREQEITKMRSRREYLESLHKKK